MSLWRRSSLVVLLALVFAGGCRSSPSLPIPLPTPEAPAAPLSAGIDQGPIVGTFKTKTGLAISIIQSDERDEGESAVEMPLSVSHEFEGKARRAAKTSLIAGAIEEFDSVESLWHTLEDDEDMINRQPAISHAATSRRVMEERRRVRVDALLCAASREDDNDYHLILCDDPSAPASDRHCINVEVSALPPQSSVYRKRLANVRQQFSDLLEGNVPGHKYAFYKPAIPVTVTGSLFYDIDHKPGTVGPKALRPTTAWEIHPIESVVVR